MKKLSELDDAALGKRLRAKIAGIEDAAEQLNRVTSFAAAMLLCDLAIQNNASQLEIKITELSLKDIEHGNWLVTAIKCVDA